MTDEPDIYEVAADMMGRTIGTRAIPREVVLRELKKMSRDQLAQTIQCAIAEAAQLERDGKIIVYDPESLRIVQELQRTLK